MPEYFIFGGCLRSELRFPELTESRGRPPDWTLRLATISRADQGRVLSDVELSPNCRVTISRGSDWLRYTHSCSGTFEIFANGTRILFEPRPNGDIGIARTDFISRVLLHCVDRARIAWLHGSAVRVDKRAIAFIGQSGAGKSTIALALARAGCEHVCDDTLPVEAGVPPIVWPSDHIIRLRADTRVKLASCAHATRRESDGKFILTGGAFDSREVMLAPEAPGAGRTPLAAVYLLKPATSPMMGEPVMRRALGPTSAVPRLMHHLKLDPVIGPEDPARLVRQLGTIAGSTPIYELTVSRDWAQFDDVVAQILAWHREPDGSAIGGNSHLAVPA